MWLFGSMHVACVCMQLCGSLCVWCWQRVSSTNVPLKINLHLTITYRPLSTIPRWSWQRNFCTCQDSNAVVACAKISLWFYHFIVHKQWFILKIYSKFGWLPSLVWPLPGAIAQPLWYAQHAAAHTRHPQGPYQAWQEFNRHSCAAPGMPVGISWHREPPVPATRGTFATVFYHQRANTNKYTHRPFHSLRAQPT